MIFSKECEYEILTPTGFQNFDGITKRVDTALKFHTTNRTITTSETHRFIIDGKEAFASTILPGDCIAPGEIVFSIERLENVELYDPINVDGGNIYLGNGFEHHNCQFLGSSNTLISGQALSTMSSVVPIIQNLNTDIYESPVQGRIYTVVVDVARGVGLDYSAFVVFDSTEAPYRIVAKYRSNTIQPMLYPNYIYKVAKEYNDAYILVEVNDIGGEISDILHHELEYENLICTVTENNRTAISPGFGKSTTIGIRTNKSVKKIGCLTLKTIVESQHMVITDADIIKELSVFVQKNNSFQADEGYNDDLAMCLVLFAWMTTNQYFKELTNVDVRERLFKAKMQNIEDEMVPFGFIQSDGYTTEDDLGFKAGEDFWSLSSPSDSSYSY